MILSLHGGGYMATTAQRMREALELRKMKQIDLALQTGIGKSSISTYLTGEYNPKQKNLYKIAKALNVSETWLMGLDVPMERTNNIVTSQELQEQVEELGFHNFINLISSAGYEITNLSENIYEILSERYHWCFKISKDELEELDKNIMNYVCYATDKFMSEKYDSSLKQNPDKKNIVPMTVSKKSYHKLNAAHAISGSSKEDQDFDEDIMNGDDF